MHKNCWTKEGTLERSTPTGPQVELSFRDVRKDPALLQGICAFSVCTHTLDWRASQTTEAMSTLKQTCVPAGSSGPGRHLECHEIERTRLMLVLTRAANREKRLLGALVQ